MALKRLEVYPEETFCLPIYEKPPWNGNFKYRPVSIQMNKAKSSCMRGTCYRGFQRLLVAWPDMWHCVKSSLQWVHQKLLLRKRRLKSLSCALMASLELPVLIHLKMQSEQPDGRIHGFSRFLFGFGVPTLELGTRQINKKIFNLLQMTQSFYTHWY